MRHGRTVQLDGGLELEPRWRGDLHHRRRCRRGAPDPVVQVSLGTDAEQWPVVAADDGGRYLVAWRRLDNGEESILGRFYAPDATPLGPEFAIDTGAGTASLPDAAMNGAGEAVVVSANEGNDP